MDPKNSYSTRFGALPTFVGMPGKNPTDITPEVTQQTPNKEVEAKRILEPLNKEGPDSLKAPQPVPTKMSLSDSLKGTLEKIPTSIASPVDRYREAPAIEKNNSIPLSIAPKPVPEAPARTPFQRITKPDIGPERLRTYEGDVAETIQRNKTSTLQIALAEQRKKGKEGLASISNSSGHSRSLLKISLLLFLAGGVILAAVYSFIMSKPRTTAVAERPQTLILAEDEQSITIPATGENVGALATAIKSAESAALPSGTIRNVTFSQTILNQKQDLTATELFSALGIHAPATLVRSLGDNFMVGSYGDASSSDSFIILTPVSFETVFAAMLQWEPTMQSDTSNLLPLPALELATTTATTSAFTDAVIENNDVRLVRQNGNPVLLYSFPDRTHLVITTSEDALREIFTRLTTAETVTR